MTDDERLEAEIRKALWRERELDAYYERLRLAMAPSGFRRIALAIPFWLIVVAIYGSTTVGMLACGVGAAYASMAPVYVGFGCYVVAVALLFLVWKWDL